MTAYLIPPASQHQALLESCLAVREDRRQGSPLGFCGLRDMWEEGSP